MKIKDFVYILAGDEEGGWGIVRYIDGTGIHVAVAGGNDVRLYDRDELRRPRNQEALRHSYRITA